MGLEIDLLKTILGSLAALLGTFLVSAWAYSKGYIGTGDINFLVLGFQRTQDQRRTLLALAVEDQKLPQVVDNRFLRLRIRWNFWRSRNGMLRLSPGGQARVLSAFRTFYSKIANTDAHDWALGRNATYHNFVFSVFHKQARSLRQIRAVSMDVELLDFIRKNKWENIHIPEDLKFLIPVVEWMIREPNNSGYYVVVRKSE